MLCKLARRLGWLLLRCGHGRSVYESRGLLILG